MAMECLLAVHEGTELKKTVDIHGNDGYAQDTDVPHTIKYIFTRYRCMLCVCAMYGTCIVLEHHLEAFVCACCHGN